MIHTLDLTYNIQEARDYLEALNNEYQHLHWWYRKDHNEPAVIEAKNNMDQMHGWGLQTVYADPSFPYHCDLDPHDEGPEYFKDTAMVFGFFQRLKDQFHNPFRSFLMSFPPNQHIGKWLPTPPLHGKIFVPITTNNNTLLISHTNPLQTVVFELGKIYLIDTTTNYAEFKNNGDTEITFITFNIPQAAFDHALQLKGIV